MLDLLAVVLVVAGCAAFYVLIEALDRL